MQAIIHDDGLAPLAPLTDLRPSFDVRTGALTTRQRLERTLGLDVAGLLVPDELAPLVREAQELPVNELRGDAPLLLINGRCVIPVGEIARLAHRQVLVEVESGHTIAACLTPAEIATVHAGDEIEVERIEIERRVLLHRPWDVIRFRDEAMAVDLSLLHASERAVLPEHAIRIGHEPLSVDASAKLYPGITLDTEYGGIWIGPHARIRPGVTIIGPATIGEGSTILDKALIKPQTAIGPMCKVAGEVGGTIFQGHANKAHDGHLGDSWIGAWANMGAGTTNSNLLNTYGDIPSCAAPGMSMERTGMQFLGVIMGDHVKTAISTRIMTGAVMHTGVMWAAGSAVSGCVAPFSWVTDAGTKSYRADRFMDVARTVMARRDVVPGEAYVNRLRGLIEA